MTRLRKMKGFTLIELIVVVIIIGVLAAVAAVAYNKFVGDARTKAAKANAKVVADKITAQAASASDGDSAAWVKSEATAAKLTTDIGADPTLFKKADKTTALADADVAAIATGSTFWLGDASHGCLITLAETATISACQ